MRFLHMSYLELLKLASPEAVVVVTALIVLAHWPNESQNRGEFLPSSPLIGLAARDRRGPACCRKTPRFSRACS